MADELPILEKAQQLMENDEIPEDVTRSLQWAGLIHVYKQTARTNGRVTRLEFGFIFLLFVVGVNADTIVKWFTKLF